MTTNDLEKTLAAVQDRLERLEAERRPLRLRRAAWVALVVGLIGGTAMAAAVWPATFQPDAPALAADMNDYFNDLKASTVPAGGIVFFAARPLNGTPCPPGWSQYASGNGRLIVGTGASGIGLASGTPLSSGETRTHNHVWARQDSANKWLSFDGGGLPLEVINWAGGMNEGTGTAYFPLATTSAIAGVARDWWTAMGSSNLPYIQLLACQKD